ncbi:hypothetical protein Taro_004021 [Colocasia esculenta]|uniref:Uncharacterized protein n=1 Tax=Colocasia esculenta TaxID=4460 RepID=A0A843TTM7_COLES|nr:hypothetical protein [Colocasia esculenta]
MPQGRKGVVSAFLGGGFLLPEVGGEAGAQGGRGTHCRRRSSHRRYRDPRKGRCPLDPRDLTGQVDPRDLTAQVDPRAKAHI